MRLKTLNGAPLREHLDFSDTILLNSEDCTTFGPVELASSAEDSTPALKWRCLSSKGKSLRTGWSQPQFPGSSLYQDESDIFLPHVQQASMSMFPDDTTNIDPTVSFNDPSIAVDGYLQHSFIFHDTLLSSQVLQDDGAEKTIGSSSFLTTSFGTTASDLSSPSKVSGHTAVLQVPSKMSVTPLGSLPSAHRLRSLYPQTPTPNFVCALMAKPEQREVFVRKGAYKMNLWEIVVADDTRSDFKVSFWIRPPRESNSEQNHAEQIHLQTLQAVNIGDILLLRNIALTSFRDTVFGQSLNPAITRARTSVDVLMSSSGVSVGQLGGLPAPVVETFMRVKRWARAHVASHNTNTRKRKGSAVSRKKSAKWSFSNHDIENSMPPDTMEAV